MNTQFLAAAVVILALTGFSNAICRFTDKMTPVDVNMDQLASKRLNIVYRPLNDFGRTLDHSYIDMTKIGGSKYRAINTFVKKDNSTILRNYTMDYKDGIMHETYGYHDESGDNYKATSYILARTNEDAILFYRCSNRDYPEDFRFIALPDGNTMSDDSLSQLMAVDKRFNFNIRLFRLPNDLLSA